MFDFVAIDFETANNNLNSACSIGIAAVKDMEIVSKEYYLIKPPTDKFDSGNVKIHGITYDMVKNEDQFPAIWKKIEHYFDNVMVAHNAQFDFSVLKCLIDTYNIEPFDCMYIDSRTISSRICECGTSLEEVLKFLDISINNHHNALDDAEACANILIAVINKIGLPSFNHFALVTSPDIVKLFSKIKASKTFKPEKFSKFHEVKISELTATTSEFDSSHPFFQKSIVLTGELEKYERSAAMQQIVNAGGIVKSSISRKTDFLVVGKQDKTLVGDDGMSSKEEKAYALIEKGCKITILNEDQFIQLLN